uniref:Mo-dependent nitrogenase family protein n=1 Tax=Cyanothece sp. (strain PCC 7425 / ATCC 29141) TaxID=395961 RepID=B8HM92_CYAP4
MFFYRPPSYPRLAMTTLTSIPPSGNDWLTPLRRWLDRLTISNPKFAHLICRLIPCTCPFERDINLWGQIYHIPPLCKLNPLYNELISLRFRALSYLTDVCHEDVGRYLC